MDRIAKASVLVGLMALMSACIVAPREGHYDRDHHRYYHERGWHDCGPHDDHYCR